MLLFRSTSPRRAALTMAPSVGILCSVVGLLLLRANLGLGAAADAPDAFLADVNDLSDSILKSVATYVADNDMTVAHLPDIQQDFSFTFAWILSLTGMVNLTEGTLRNFQTIERYGSSRMSYFVKNKQLVLQMGINLPTLHATYDFGARAGVVKQSGQLDVQVSGVKANMIFGAQLSDVTVALADFKIVDLGKISVKVKDGVVGWLASVIGNVVIKFMKSTLKETLESEIPPIINKILENLDLASMLRPRPDDFLGY